MSSKFEAPQPKEDAPSVETDAQAHLDQVADLFRREHGALRARLRCKAASDVANQIADEAFARVVQLPPRHVSYLRAYLYRIAHNLLVAYYRHEATKRRKVSLLEFELDQHAPSPETDLIDDEDIAVVKEEINDLSPLTREVLRLNTEELSSQEIAARLTEQGTPIHARTVQRRLNQAYKHLRERLDASQDPKPRGSK